MASIKFDDVEILDSTHRPQFVKHESAPERILMTSQVAREDGDVLITTRYGRKIIQLQGTLKADSQDLLDAAIDTFKELFSRPEKNLDISWAAGTLRYVATCSRHDFDRDHYHLSIVPWSAEFTVSAGFGKDGSDTLALDEEELTTDDGDEEGTFIADTSFDMEGSQAAKPLITLEIVSADAEMKGIEYLNEDTGERIIVTRDTDWSAAAGKQIVIDCENKKVTDNLETTEQVEGAFLGMFPRFAIGDNNVRLRTGGFINQRSSEDAIASAAPAVAFTTTALLYGVSFQVPYADATFGGLIVGLSKVGTPTDDLHFHIKEDDGGEPDLGANVASWSIDEADVPTYPSYAYVQAWAGGAVSLVANRRYWLVAVPQAGTGSHHFRWHASTAITYARGSSKLSSDNGSSWTPDSNIPSFRLLFGGLSAETELKHTVSYRKTYL